MAYDWSRLTDTHKISKTGGIKILVYGMSGSGKTSLIKTIPAPHDKILVLNADGGTLSISRDEAGNPIEIPAAPITSFSDFTAICEDIDAAVDAGKFPFEWLVVDSFTEVAERCLAEMMKAHPDDTWTVYRELKNSLVGYLKWLRDLDGVNILVTCEMERQKTEQGALLYQPSLPGKASTHKAPYAMDEVFALRVEGEERSRYLQTDRDHQYEAKDRSGRLDAFEPADIGQIVKKILGE